MTCLPVSTYWSMNIPSSYLSIDPIFIYLTPRCVLSSSLSTYLHVSKNICASFRFLLYLPNLSIHPSIHLSTDLSILSVCLSIYQSTYLPTYVIYLSCLSVLATSWSIQYASSLATYPSLISVIYLPIYLSVYLHMYASLCFLSINLSTLRKCCACHTN